MVYGAIGGMQLKRWSGYFKIILPTMKVLKEAKRTEGCVMADTFKSGDVFFAVSVWQTQDQMQAFGKSGLHGHLIRLAMDQMAVFYNHSQSFDDIPSRVDSAAAWRAVLATRDGKATVGVYGYKG